MQIVTCSCVIIESLKNGERKELFLSHWKLLGFSLQKNTRDTY